MKVLLPIIYHDLTHCIARAFEEEGHEVLVVDWRNTSATSRSLVSREIIAAAKDFRPDLAFCQFQAPGIITPQVPQALKDVGCFSINWSGDVRHPLPAWYRDLAPYFDVTSFTNVPDVEEIRAMGHRAEFLQIGYDEQLYNPPPPDTPRSGVVFIGNNYGGYKFAESNGRRTMVKAMCEAFPDRFKVYGMSWEGIVPEANHGGYVREPSDADILRRASVAVGFDHFHRAGFASDRLLRAAACGCAVVNQYYEGIEQEHPYVRSSHTIEGMVEAVRTLLEDEAAARMEGDLNAANTLHEHRWNNRVNQMIQWVK
jgi:hypothetical protein